jgi:hypothetical protein
VERFSLNTVDSALLDLKVWPSINEDLIDDPVLRDTVERHCRAIRLFVDRAPGIGSLQRQLICQNGSLLVEALFKKFTPMAESMVFVFSLHTRTANHIVVSPR